jgi:hypothetical protein
MGDSPSLPSPSMGEGAGGGGGGFDVILCNPPWERIKLQEQEFFASKDPEIANAPNKSARQRLIQQLPKTNPTLWNEYNQALHDADAQGKFLRQSERFKLTARGDINTYSVFAELFTNLINPSGRVGVVIPTGIATDDTNKFFFSHLVENKKLASLYDFENREKLFPAVDSRYKFSLLTIRGTKDAYMEPAKFAFFLTNVTHLRDEQRIFTLTADDFNCLNPNTKTCPVFRTKADAELTKKIYERVPVLVNEKTGENPWGIRFMTMFHMSNDSHLFRTRDQLEEKGFRLIGNRFVKDNEVWLPLYEAKMIWHFDHRFGTYEGVTGRSNTNLPTPSTDRYKDPYFLVQPWYWVLAQDAKVRLGEWQKGWLIGFRNVTNATNERTVIFSLLPYSGVGHSMPLICPNVQSNIYVVCLLATINSVVFDYITRQKIGGINLTYGYLTQLSVVSPSTLGEPVLMSIAPRVMELIYTAWDIKPFADDVWRDADEGLRAIIRKHWEESQAATGGHEWNPPEWAEIAEDGVPLPPFKWDENRRAVLRAELDAYYAKLYGLTRKQLRYILDPADLTEKEVEDILDPWEEVEDPLDPEGYASRVQASTFPDETFRVLKEKEIRQYGEYRTRHLVLEAWDRLE